MGMTVRDKLYFTSCKHLHQVDGNDEIEETTGHKEVCAYVIEDEEGLLPLKTIIIANYKNSEEELVEALEEEYGKKYSAREFILI